MHQKILFVADKINKKKADVIRDALQIMVESTLEEILPDYKENK
jgi:HD superfamily phosphohydrolase YqeK